MLQPCLTLSKSPPGGSWSVEQHSQVCVGQRFSVLNGSVYPKRLFSGSQRGKQTVWHVPDQTIKRDQLNEPGSAVRAGNYQFGAVVCYKSDRGAYELTVYCWAVSA